MEDEVFVKSPVKKAYFKFTLPVVCSMIVGMIYNMADVYFIGHTGDTNQVAAVSLCAPLFMIMNALGNILGLGGSTAISRFLGERKDVQAKKIGSFCLYGNLICGCIVGIIMILFSSNILKLLGADKDTFKFALNYYKYIALAAPFIIFASAPTNIIRTEGLTKEVMVVSILGSVINIILDPIFIFLMDKGVAGAAIATLIANIISDVLFILIILKRSKKFSLALKRSRIGIKTLKDILFIGIPGSLQSFMQCIATMIINWSLYSYGNDKIAAMGIAMKITMIIAMINVGFSFGMQPLIGYNYGAKNIKRLKEILSFAVKFELGLTIIMAATMFIVARPLISAFMNNDGIIAYGSVMLRILLLTAPFISIIFICTVVFQSAGKAGAALLLSLSHQGIIFIPVILILKNAMGYYGVISAQSVTDVLTVILGVTLFKYEFSKLFKNEIQLIH